MKKLGKEEQEMLLKEFCITNRFSYSAVRDVLYFGMLGEHQQNNLLKYFKYWVSGKLNIAVDNIIVDLSFNDEDHPLSVDNLMELL
jgi:hypothetical protein